MPPEFGFKEPVGAAEYCAVPRRNGSPNLLAQLLRLAAAALFLDQAAFGGGRPFGAASAVPGGFGEAFLAGGGRGSLDFFSKETDGIGPVPGLGSRRAHAHHYARRQVAESDGSRNFIDVLAARTSRAAEDLLDFAGTPKIHAATFTAIRSGRKCRALFSACGNAARRSS